MSETNFNYIDPSLYVKEEAVHTFYTVRYNDMLGKNPAKIFVFNTQDPRTPLHIEDYYWVTEGDNYNIPLRERENVLQPASIIRFNKYGQPLLIDYWKRDYSTYAIPSNDRNYFSHKRVENTRPVNLLNQLSQYIKAPKSGWKDIKKSNVKLDFKTNAYQISLDQSFLPSAINDEIRKVISFFAFDKTSHESDYFRDSLSAKRYLIERPLSSQRGVMSTLLNRHLHDMDMGLIKPPYLKNLGL